MNWQGIVGAKNEEIAALKAEHLADLERNFQLRGALDKVLAERDRLRAALEGIVKALEDGEEQGFLHMHIVTALDIARRALEGR